MKPRIAIAVLVLLAALVGGAQLSGATFFSNSGSGQSGVKSADYVAPSVALDPVGAVGGSKTLTATASDDPGSGVASVRFEYAVADSASYTTICTDTTAPYSCAWSTLNLTEGDYDVRVVATDRAGQTAIDAEEGVVVDRTLPTVSVSDPGATVAGVVDVRATAADADSGVASVTIQRAPTGTTTWTDICTDTTDPYACKWDTSALANGSGWDLRAIAIDVAGNSRTSALVVNRKVDNTRPTITLDDPGADLRGSVNLVSNPVSPTGITSVAIQYQADGTSTWTTVCTRTTAPWTCAWDTTRVASGVYDLRAVMVTASGATVTSATVQDRRVDNSPVRGVDVQTINGAGGTAGRVNPGDQLVLTYSAAMNPGTLIPGWDGTGSAALSFRLRDAGVAGTTSDQLQLLTTGGAATGLGSVLLGANLVKQQGANFAATAVLSRTSAGATIVTITVGNLVSGGALRTSSTLTNPVWYPSATARDTAGIATATTPVPQSGAAKRVF